MNRLCLTHMLITLAIFCSSSPAAKAEVVRVQTGEHASFTRLAMVFDTPVAWTAGRVASGFGVEFQSSDLELDLTDAFRLIPRDRITGLIWDSGALRLEIDSTCACHLDIFELPGNTLVIDVRSGPPPLASPYEISLEVEEKGPEMVGETELTEVSIATRPILPTLFDVNRPAIAMPIRQSTVPPKRNLAGMEERLIAALGRAASDGLVDMEVPASALSTEAPPMAADRYTNGATPVTLLDHITSRRSTQLPETADQKAAQALLASCPNPGDLDVPTWGKGTPQQMLAAGRADLFDDLGRIDQDAVVSVARNLIYLGFGAEATNHLSLLGQRSREIDLLNDLANIMDRVPERVPMVLGNAFPCPSAAALWGLLSGANTQTMRSLDAKAVQRAFSQLPAHLQRLLGVETVIALRSVDAPEQAAAVLALLQRLPGDTASGLSSLLGEDSLVAGDTTNGEARLGSVINESSDASPEALLTLLRARESRGATVPEDMILLAESLAQELRETRISQDLTDAAARAHARDARFEPAFALMAILDGRDMVTQSDLRSDLAQKLAQRAPDDGFLLIAFQEGLMLPSADLSDVAAQALAERLLSLGFGVEADGLAAMIPGAAPDLQLLRGRIAFARGYPELALEHLTALESRAAATLRAEIRAAMGATGEAADLFGRIGASKQAASAAWASGDPTVIEQHGAPPQQAFIRSLTGGEGGVPLTETAQVATQDVTQANLRSLLEGTAAFRSAAEALLADQPNRNQ